MKQGSSGRIHPESVSNFIDKTYDILENPQNEMIVSWSAKGTSFIVKDVVAFSNNVLPKYFKHSNFSSFVRQLNMYNFHKVRGDRLENEFQHNKFRKGQRELLTLIRRKGNDPSDTANNNSGSEPVLTEQKIEVSKKTLAEISEAPEQEQVNRNLEMLVAENKRLKKLKAKYYVDRKSFSESDQSVEQKFYKFITTMLSLKIRDNLGSRQFAASPAPLKNFEQLLNHIVSPQKALSYEYYQNCSRQLLQRYKDESFMLPTFEPVLMENVPSLQLIIAQKYEQQ